MTNLQPLRKKMDNWTVGSVTVKIRKISCSYCKIFNWGMYSRQQKIIISPVSRFSFFSFLFFPFFHIWKKTSIKRLRYFGRYFLQNNPEYSHMQFWLDMQLYMICNWWAVCNYLQLFCSSSGKVTRKACTVIDSFFLLLTHISEVTDETEMKNRWADMT